LAAECAVVSTAVLAFAGLWVDDSGGATFLGLPISFGTDQNECFRTHYAFGWSGTTYGLVNIIRMRACKGP